MKRVLVTSVVAALMLGVLPSRSEAAVVAVAEGRGLSHPGLDGPASIGMSTSLTGVFPLGFDSGSCNWTVNEIPGAGAFIGTLQAICAGSRIFGSCTLAWERLTRTAFAHGTCHFDGEPREVSMVWQMSEPTGGLRGAEFTVYATMTTNPAAV